MEIELGIDGLRSKIGNNSSVLSLLLEVSPGELRERIKTQFISQNLKKGMSIVALLSRESPEDFLKNLRSHGVDTSECIKEGRLVIVDWYTHKRKRILGIEEESYVIRSSRDILNACISVNKALNKISESHNKIAYVDVIKEAINLFSWDKTKDYITDIMNKFQENDFTTLYLIDEGIDDSTISNIQPNIDGALKIFEENNTQKMSFQSLDSKLKNLDPLELIVDEKRVKVKKEKNKEVLTPSISLKNISSKIFGKSNKEKSKEKGWSGRTNGLTNGKTNGKVNGRTNGLTNGKTNGKVNGRTNGLTNGKTNGKVNGRTNGLTNGKTNGKVNGKINGLVNSQEKSTINGFINGDLSDKSIDDIIVDTSLSSKDGLVDGIVGMGGEQDLYSDYIKEDGEKSLPAEDGLVNGLVGRGLPNYDEGIIKDTLASHRMDLGEGGSLPHRGMPPSWFKKGLGTVLIMIFLLTIPIMINLLYIPVEVDIEIDGDFEDWHAVRAYYDPENVEVEDTSLDIREYRLKESDGYLYLYMRANGTLFEIDEGVHSVRFFIDVEDYGYEIGDIKADYLFEVYGWDENIEGTTLQRFNESRGSDDWNGFRNSGGGQAISEGSELEARFWIGGIAEDKQPSMVIHSKSPRG